MTTHYLKFMIENRASVAGSPAFLSPDGGPDAGKLVFYNIEID